MSILKNEIKRLQARIVEIEKEEEQERLNKCANDITWNFAKLKRLNKDVSERCAKNHRQKQKEYEEYTRNRYNKQYETFELWLEAETKREEQCPPLSRRTAYMLKDNPSGTATGDMLRDELGITDSPFQDDASHVRHVMARMDELVVSSHNLFGIMVARIEALDNQLNGR